MTPQVIECIMVDKHWFPRQVFFIREKYPVMEVLITEVVHLAGQTLEVFLFFDVEGNDFVRGRYFVDGLLQDGRANSSIHFFQSSSLASLGGSNCNFFRMARGMTTSM